MFIKMFRNLIDLLILYRNKSVLKDKPVRLRVEINYGTPEEGSKHVYEEFIKPSTKLKLEARGYQVEVLETYYSHPLLKDIK